MLPSTVSSLRWSVHAHFAAGVQQRAPEAASGLPEAAQPVADHAHAHTGGGAFGQRIAKRAAGGIVANDVIFQQYHALRGTDGRQPRVEVHRRIDQQLHRVAADQRRAGGAAERTLGHQPGRGLGRGLQWHAASLPVAPSRQPAIRYPWHP
jgi:hypothetical protein